MKKNLLLFVLLLLLSIPSILPLFSSGFYPMHDDTQVARVFDMKEALSDGIFPVRWVENLGYGYGYPIFNFYAPLAYYVGGFINLAGFDSLTATKLMIGFATILAGISMYFFAREFWGRIGGFISALLYLYAPYHALNIYVRGAIAELWAYAFIPFVFLGLYKLNENISNTIKDKKNKQIRKDSLWSWIAVTSLSYAAIIASHNLTAFMVTPFIGLFMLFLTIKLFKRSVLKSIVLPASLLLGVMISAFYWLPVIFEMQYTNVLSVVGGGSDYSDHFVCLQQLWNSPWAYGGSIPGCGDGLSFKIGKLHLFLGALALVPLVLRSGQSRIRLTLLLSIAGLLLAVFLTTEYSQFVWDAVHQMSFFQFPWRFLVLVSFFISFLGAAFIIVFPSKVRLAIGAVLAVIILFVNLEVFTPSSIIRRTAEDYTNKKTIQWQTSKISDEYMPQGFQKPKSEKEVPTQKVIVDPKTANLLSSSSSTERVQAVIESSQKTNVKLAIAYFPAWKVYLDGKEIPFKNTSAGLQVTFPAGKHTLEAVFIQTPIEQTGNILSLTGVILLVAGIITQRKDKKKIAKSS